MARNLDDFAAELAAVTHQAIQAASNSLDERSLLEASANGDAAAVHHIASSMTTAQLHDFQRKHSH